MSGEIILMKDNRGKVLFEIDGEHFRIEDLGDSMTLQFIELYKKYLYSQIIDEKKFINKSIEYIEANYKDYEQIDKFFNNFTIPWRKKIQKNPAL